MTSQCASGSGPVPGEHRRYLGVAVERSARCRVVQDPEKVSSICAVLAETDVINMVSAACDPDILKGHPPVDGLAHRQTAQGHRREGRRGAADRRPGAGHRPAGRKVSVRARSHPDSIYAGAIGAVVGTAYRHAKLEAGSKPQPRLNHSNARKVPMALLIVARTAPPATPAKPVCPANDWRQRPDLRDRPAALRRCVGAGTSRSASWVCPADCIEQHPTSSDRRRLLGQVRGRCAAGLQPPPRRAIML